MSAKIPERPLGAMVNWWQDPRLVGERRMVLFSVLFVVVGLAAVALLAFMKQKADAGTVVPELTATGAAVPVPVANPAGTPLTAPTGWLDQAASRIMAGELDAAARNLDAAEVELYRLRGIVAHRRGDREVAAMCFLRALELDPASVADRINLASVYQLEGRFSEAREQLEQAGKIDPDNDYVRARQLLVMIEGGESVRAAQEVRAALEASPENALAQVGVAAAALELRAGNFGKASDFLLASQGVLPGTIFAALLQEAPLSTFSHLPQLAPYFKPILEEP